MARATVRKLGIPLSRRMLYLAEYARAKGIHVVLEQPFSSLLPLYPPVRRFLRRHAAQSLQVSLGAWGAASEKKVILHTTASWLSPLGIKLDPLRREELKRLRSRIGFVTVKRSKGPDGRSKVVGGKDLQKTSRYPVGLGLEVGKLLTQKLKESGFPPLPAPICDAGLTFEDDGEDESDSGLEDIL